MATRTRRASYTPQAYYSAFCPPGPNFEIGAILKGNIDKSKNAVELAMSLREMANQIEGWEQDGYTLVPMEDQKPSHGYELAGGQMKWISNVTMEPDFKLAQVQQADNA